MSTPDLGALRDAIPVKVRRTIYAVYLGIVVLIGAVEVGYGPLGGDPLWLSIAAKVATYLGIPIGALALVNAKPTGGGDDTDA